MTNGNDLTSGHLQNMSVRDVYGNEKIITDRINGLTKREHFAAVAMQGLLTRVPNRQNGEVDLGIIESKRISDESVIMADALIKSLNENQCKNQ